MYSINQFEQSDDEETQKSPERGWEVAQKCSGREQRVVPTEAFPFEKQYVQ